jgi:hypothetical protein
MTKLNKNYGTLANVMEIRWNIAKIILSLFKFSKCIKLTIHLRFYRYVNILLIKTIIFTFAGYVVMNLSKSIITVYKLITNNDLNIFDNSKEIYTC